MQPDDKAEIRGHRARVVVIEDHALIRMTVSARLRDQGYEVAAAETGQDGLAEFDRGADVVLLDYRLPDADGMELLATMVSRRPAVPVIMMTGHSSIAHAVTAVKAGAYDYVSKPVDLDVVASLVRRALDSVKRAAPPAPPLPDSDVASALSAIVGDSPPIRELRALLPRIAQSPATTVLITGESGTGKDVAARVLHALSQRASEPFVNITCSALPAALLESELFGHERGAFTDAKNRKVGLFERASGGTVFLDEVGELELGLQAKLLRFLEAKAFRRVGGSEEIQADVRVVAATNVDLRQAVAQHQFREDLYYRLAVMPIHIPPLREREGDIELLVAHFIERYNEQLDRDVQRVSPAAMSVLRRHPWPGNVRELRNALERAILLASGTTLEARDFAFLGQHTSSDSQVRLPAGGLDVREVERSLVEQALERTGGNKTQAARLLGMNRDQIRYRMRRYGLEGNEPG